MLALAAGMAVVVLAALPAASAHVPADAFAATAPAPAPADPLPPDGAPLVPDPATESPEPPLPVYPVDLTVEQTVPPAVGPGRAWTYEVVVANNGTAPVSGARLQTAVPAGLGTASWTCDPGRSSTCLAGSTGRGSAVDAAVDLLPGSQVTFTFSGTRPPVAPADPSAPGDAAAPAGVVVVQSTVAVVPPPGSVDGDPSDNADSAELSLTPWWLEVRQTTRSATGAGLSRAPGGAVVTYVVTVSNPGVGASDPATFVVDLAGVLDDATWLGDAAVTGSGTGAESRTGAAPRLDAAAETLTWSAQVAAGERTSLQFSVAVDPRPAGDGVLVSDVSSAVVGSSCPTDPGATRFRGRGCESVVRVDAAPPTEAPTQDIQTAAPPAPPRAASPGTWLADHGGEVAMVAGGALAVIVGSLAVGMGVTAHRRRVRGLR